MPSIGDLFGKDSVAAQFLLWNVLSQVIQPLLLPVQVELTKLMYEADPGLPIPPASAAEAVARGLMAAGAGKDAAAQSGIGGDVFDALVANAGNGPALATVLELYRRQLIDVGSADPTETSVHGALADQGVRPEWHGLLTKLAVSIPDQAQVLNAWLEGQIGEAEARDRLLKAGMAPDWIQTAYNTNGQAPTPTQALELLNRGIIPERGTGPASVSYEQSFLEGPWRNKWLTPFLALAEYLPPPRTVTAMYHGGQLTHDQAASLLSKQGLAPELVTAYLAPAATSVTHQDKALTRTDIVAAYADGLLTRPAATKALEALTYSAHDAGTILDLADVRTVTAQVSAGVTRARSLFEAGKLTEHDAIGVLLALGMDHAQAQGVVDTWALTQATVTRTLTPAQIEAAYAYSLFTSADAVKLIMAAGYDEFDAWIMLSARIHGPLHDYPRPHSPYPAPPKPKKT